MRMVRRMPTTKKIVRDMKGSWPTSLGILRHLYASSPTDNVRKKPMMNTNQPVMPRSTKEWTEKSANTPERVRKVA